MSQIHELTIIMICILLSVLWKVQWRLNLYTRVQIFLHKHVSSLISSFTTIMVPSLFTEQELTRVFVSIKRLWQRLWSHELEHVIRWTRKVLVVKHFLRAGLDVCWADVVLLSRLISLRWCQLLPEAASHWKLFVFLWPTMHWMIASGLVSVTVSSSLAFLAMRRHMWSSFRIVSLIRVKKQQLDRCCWINMEATFNPEIVVNPQHTSWNTCCIYNHSNLFGKYALNLLRIKTISPDSKATLCFHVVL